MSAAFAVRFKCWADDELNTPEALEDGKVYFNYDWVEGRPPPTHHFRSMINNWLPDRGSAKRLRRANQK